MSQVLSVGMIVHFYPAEGSQKGQPYPAIITHVNENGSVNLHVFNDGEHFFRGENHLKNVREDVDPGTRPLFVRIALPPATTEVPPPATTEPLGTSDGPAAGPNVRAPADN